MRHVAGAPLAEGRPLRFSVLRVPFFLEPDYPRGEDFHETNLERLKRKWGGKEAFAAQKTRHGLKERGREVGIQDFKARRIASSTWASHRLVQWVTRTAGVTAAEKLYALLNHRHFELGRKLNDQEMLAEAAASAAGVDADDARAFLATDEGSAEIEAAQRMLQMLGVHSIPTFLVDGRHVLRGAAHADDFVSLFRALEAEGAGESDDEFARESFMFADALRIPKEVLTAELDLDAAC